jgi:hypothetical protein
MDIFNEHLRGKKFIFFTDHKTLEKMGRLHTKILNSLKAALLEHELVVQNNKGNHVPMDYFSRLSTPQVATTEDPVTAFDPFQPHLTQLQLQD